MGENTGYSTPWKWSIKTPRCQLFSKIGLLQDNRIATVYQLYDNLRIKDFFKNVSRALGENSLNWDMEGEIDKCEFLCSIATGKKVRFANQDTAPDILRSFGSGDWHWWKEDFGKESDGFGSDIFGINTLGNSLQVFSYEEGEKFLAALTSMQQDLRKKNIIFPFFDRAIEAMHQTAIMREIFISEQPLIGKIVYY